MKRFAKHSFANSMPTGVRCASACAKKVCLADSPCVAHFLGLCSIFLAVTYMKPSQVLQFVILLSLYACFKKNNQAKHTLYIYIDEQQKNLIKYSYSSVVGYTK